MPSCHYGISLPPGRRVLPAAVRTLRVFLWIFSLCRTSRTTTWSPQNTGMSYSVPGKCPSPWPCSKSSCSTVYRRRDNSSSLQQCEKIFAVMLCEERVERVLPDALRRSPSHARQGASLDEFADNGRRRPQARCRFINAHETVPVVRENSVVHGCLLKFNNQALARLQFIVAANAVVFFGFPR